jgi:hypothetical protein
LKIKIDNKLFKLQLQRRRNREIRPTGEAVAAADDSDARASIDATRCMAPGVLGAEEAAGFALPPALPPLAPDESAEGVAMMVGCCDAVASRPALGAEAAAAWRRTEVT